MRVRLDCFFNFIDIQLIQILEVLANGLQLFVLYPDKLRGLMLDSYAFLRFPAVFPKVVHLLASETFVLFFS